MREIRTSERERSFEKLRRIRDDKETDLKERLRAGFSWLEVGISGGLF